METFLIAQVVGVIALILSIAVYQVPKRSQILSLRIAASSTLVVHFALLDAFTGSVMNFLGVVRTYIFKKRTEAQWADNRGWLYLFLALYVIFLVITWEGYRSLLPFIGLVAGTFVFWSKKPRTIRALSLIPPPVWFTYDYIVKSYPGMAIEIFIFTSVVIGIIRFDLLHQQEKKPPISSC